MDTLTQNFDQSNESTMRRQNSNLITGIFLVLAGAGLIIRKMDTNLPDWLFSWETLFIIMGLFIGFRHRFKGAAWLFFILVGVLSLVDDVVPHWNLKAFTWPIILVIMGLFFIFRPKGVFTYTNRRLRRRGDNWFANEFAQEAEVSKEDILDITAVLGNVKKVVVSKNFKGGDITCFLGGADINLSQADIIGKARLDVTTFMGGTKIIIPPTWDVQSDMVAILGGVEDKRDIRGLNINPDKVLVLDGTCIFGGIEIKSY